MSRIAENTVLGDLEIVETYAEYDGPTLFACRNALGHLYLANWISSSRERDVWLYAPMSKGRWGLLRAGEVEIRSAYAKAEGGVCIEVTIPRDGSVTTLRRLSASELVDAQLPAAGIFVEPLDEAGARVGEWESSVVDLYAWLEAGRGHFKRKPVSWKSLLWPARPREPRPGGLVPLGLKDHLPAYGRVGTLVSSAPTISDEPARIPGPSKAARAPS